MSKNTELQLNTILSKFLIDNDYENTLNDYGTFTSAGDSIAKITGLEDVQAGELVVFNNKLLGLSFVIFCVLLTIAYIVSLKKQKTFLTKFGQERFVVTLNDPETPDGPVPGTPENLDSETETEFLDPEIPMEPSLKSLCELAEKHHPSRGGVSSEIGDWLNARECGCCHTPDPILVDPALFEAAQASQRDLENKVVRLKKALSY
jgi:hypothetical protein